VVVRDCRVVATTVGGGTDSTDTGQCALVRSAVQWLILMGLERSEAGVGGECSPTEEIVLMG